MPTIEGPNPLGEQTPSDEWATSSEYWQKPRKTKKAKRFRGEPLILCGHGMSLRIEAGTLSVRNGFTHFPQRRETYRFFKGDADLPMRIIVLDGSGSISFEVLAWLSEQQVPLIKISWEGSITAVIGAGGFAANRHRVAWQAETREHQTKRMKFCNELIARKIEGCIETLEGSLERSDAWDRAVSRAETDLVRLMSVPPRTVDELRVIEANSAKAYFGAWRSTPLRWANSARYPIPEEWRAVGPRTSRFELAQNYNASHPVNAMLNYAYAVLQSQVQIKAVSEGYDPLLGIMHYGVEGAPNFVFDLMEPERPRVDRALLAFLKSETLHPADFTIREDGVVRINPQLASCVAQMASAVQLSRHE